MITGRKPYPADTPMAVLLKKATEPLPRPRIFAPDLPASAENILFRCLQPKPEHRYPTSKELVADLENVLQEVQPKRTSLLMPVLLIAAAGLLVVSAVFLLSFVNVKPGATPTPVELFSTPATGLVAPMLLPTFTETLPAVPTETEQPSTRISTQDGMEMVHVPAEEFIHGASQQDIDAILAMCSNCQRSVRSSRISETLAWSPWTVPPPTKAIRDCLLRLQATLYADPVAAREMPNAVVGELTLTPRPDGVENPPAAVRSRESPRA